MVMKPVKTPSCMLFCEPSPTWYFQQEFFDTLQACLEGKGESRKSVAKCGEEGKLATGRQHYTTGVKG